MTDNKCYDCKYRGSVPGSVHSSCKHPDLKGTFSVQAISRIFQIKANYHGVKSGWFNWPWDFDPVWLTNCNAFKEKDDE